MGAKRKLTRVSPRPAALRQSPTVEEVAELMERMVSGPGFTDPEMRDAQRADRLLCAQAIADLYGRGG